MKEKLIGILHRLFKICSPQGGESEISSYTANFLDCCGFKTEWDSHNNLLASRGGPGKMPLLHAHFENEQDEKDMERLPGMVYDRENDVFHMDGVRIGCDDKAGIGIILYLAMYSDLDFKALFTIRERGQSGIYDIKKEFFSDVCWAFSLDGAGEKKIITKFKNRETCDERFIDGVLAIGKEEGSSFREDISRLDYSAYYISEYVQNTAVLPVGFYSPHRRNDYLNVCETYKTLKFVRSCIKDRKRLMIEDKSLMGICTTY